jgi:hypothetical protein
LTTWRTPRVEIAKTGNRQHHRRYVEETGEGAPVAYRLHADGVDKIGAHRSNEPPKRQQEHDLGHRPQTAPVERDVVIVEAVSADHVHIGILGRRRHVDLEAHIPRCHAQRKAVRDEEQGFVHQEEDAARRCGQDRFLDWLSAVAVAFIVAGPVCR